MIMPVIILNTEIKAPVTSCFDCARSIDLHMQSVQHTGEKAIAGMTSGLIELGETVTWRARHLGIWQHLTTRITEMNMPHYFADEQIQGAFASFRHEHYFDERENITVMKDVFTFRSPGGFLGRMANTIFLTRYMTNLLLKRNEVIRTEAERECPM